MARKCGGCGRYISGGDGVKCKKCSQSFHPGCITNASPNNKLAPKWLCRSCGSGPSSSLNDSPHDQARETGNHCASSNEPPNQSELTVTLKAMELLRLELSACAKEVASFRQDIAQIRTALNEVNSRLDNVEHRLEILEDRQKNNKEHDWSDTVAQLRSEINDREQDLLGNDVEITGIAESGGENLFHVVKLVCDKLGVVVDEREVVNVHRSGPRRDGSEHTRPRAISLRFARRNLRDDLLNAARVRRGADTSGFGIDKQPQRFYVNERLTPSNRRLFRLARDKAKSAHWRYVWTRDGRIFARKDSGAHNTRYRIRGENDVDRIFR